MNPPNMCVIACVYVYMYVCMYVCSDTAANSGYILLNGMIAE